MKQDFSRSLVRSAGYLLVLVTELVLLRLFHAERPLYIPPYPNIFSWCGVVIAAGFCWVFSHIYSHFTPGGISHTGGSMAGYLLGSPHHPAPILLLSGAVTRQHGRAYHATPHVAPALYTAHMALQRDRASPHTAGDKTASQTAPTVICRRLSGCTVPAVACQPRATEAERQRTCTKTENQG